MNFETISNNKKKYFLYALIIGVLLLIIIVIKGSLAKYHITQSINIAKGTINYKLADFNMVAMYQENSSGSYEEISIMPSSGYIINESSSYCAINGEKDPNAVLKTIDENHTIANLQKGSKCYLYFDENKNQTAETILAEMTKNTRSSFSSTFTTSTTKTVYSAEDDDGTSYYYAGAPTDNWVKFAGFYWRIIRFNGDGSIRLIYQGPAVNTTGAFTQLTNISMFNEEYDLCAECVGYMYTIGDVHGLGTSSTIKGVLDSWYSSNLLAYTSHIDINSGFCGDRTPYTNTSGTTSGGGTGQTITYYAGYIRLRTKKAPSLKCTSSGDLYTSSSSSKGNKALTYPVGLITADEIAYAGGVYGTENTSYYLYTGEDYWTFSPSNIAMGAVGFYVNSTGNLSAAVVDGSYGVRPVINLKADTVFKANSLGTIDSPYVVEGAE